MPQHNLAEQVRRLLGVNTVVRESVPGRTIGLAEETLLRQDPNRLAAFISCLGTNPIFVKPKAGASATRGIRIAPQGGFLTLLYEEEFDLVGYEWTAIATLAPSEVYILELLTMHERGEA